MGIAKAFVAAKREFAPALKTSSNPHFRSKYADLAGCLEAVNDALLNQGIAVYQETTECENGVIVETVFLHESGETLRGGKLHVPAPKHDPQGYGSALTYARRYSIMAACGIAAEDDDGNAASRPKPAQRNPLDTVATKLAATAPQDGEPEGPYPLSVPGRDPVEFVTWQEWGEAFQELVEKVARAAKATPEERMEKLRVLREANHATLERIDPIHRIKFTGKMSSHLKELDARTTA